MAGNTNKGKRVGTALSRRRFDQMLNARREMKYRVVSAVTNMSINGDVLAMSQAITQGDTGATRDGNQITVTQLHVRLELVMNPSATVDFGRIVVFYDKQANGSLPSVTDVLASASPNSPYGAYTMVQKRFKILHDYTTVLSINGSNRAIQHVKVINLKNHKVSYINTDDSAGANSTGAIYVLLVSETATNVTGYALDVGISYYDS